MGYVEFNTSIDHLNCENITTTAELNKVYAKDHILYISYLSTMAIIGLVGNVLVLFVYIFRKKPSAHKTITSNIAVADGLVCGTVIPTEIIEKVFHFSLFNNFTCKFWITLSYFFICSSAFMIIVLSVDRYRRVCSPLKPQMNSAIAVKLITAVYVLAAFVSLPNAFIWNCRLFTTSHNLTLYVCVTETMDSSTDLPTLYNFSLLIVGSLMVTFLIIIYVCIMRKIIKHIHYIKTFQVACRRTSVFTVNGISSERANVDASSFRITKIAFAVVIVFVLSYIPSTIMKLLDTRRVWDIDDGDSTNSNFLHIFARSSVYINHIANAFIYAILDKTFRHDLKMCYTCFSARLPNKVLST